jgi:hypothetical protein
MWQILLQKSAGVDRAVGPLVKGHGFDALALTLCLCNSNATRDAVLSQPRSASPTAQMLRISLKRREDQRDLNEAVYRCPQCGTQKKRWAEDFLRSLCMLTELP